VATGASSGKFAVMSSSVHGSFDFYNNGTSYFNGSVTVDDALNISGSNRALKIEGTTVIDSSRNLTNIGTISSGAITSSGTITVNNLASDKKIAFRRTGANAFSIEHDSSQLYFYNESTSSSALSIRNNVDVRIGTCNLQIGSTTVIDSSRNLTNITSLDISNATNSTGISMTSNTNVGQGAIIRLNKAASTNQNYVSFDGDNLYFGTAASDTSNGYVGTKGSVALNLQTGYATRLTIGSTGSFDFKTNNLTNIGTISSGAITSSGTLKSTNATGLILDTGSAYRDVQFVLTGNTGNGTLEIIPMTVPGSGTASFTTHIKNLVATGTTRHDLKVDGNATFGGTISSGEIDAGGRVKVTNWIELESSGASLSAEEAGLRWDYNDTVLWYFYKNDGNDGALHIQSTATSGEADATPRVRFHRTARETYFGGAIGVNKYSVGSGLNLDVAGAIGISGTTVIDASRNGVFERLRADGGNLIMGNEAYSTSNSYVGMKTSFQSGSNDYMILSGLSDGETYVSAKDGSAVTIRGGGNNSSNQISVPDGSTITATTSDFRVTGNVTAYASDKRLKTNIKTIKNPIEKIKKIRGVEFDWLDNIENFNPKHKHETGVIAQEIEAVIPDAVSPAPFNEEYKTVDKDKIVALLIEGIKEQQKQIEELKEEVTSLRSKN